MSSPWELVKVDTFCQQERENFYIEKRDTKIFRFSVPKNKTTQHFLNHLYNIAEEKILGLHKVMMTSHNFIF